VTELHVWAIPAAIGGDDPVLIACPRCTETQMRYVETTITRATIDIRFVCSQCEQQASLHLDCDRSQSRVTWQWSR